MFKDADMTVDMGILFISVLWFLFCERFFIEKTYGWYEKHGFLWDVNSKHKRLG